MEDKPKILKDFGPVSNSVNKEGEIQSIQVQDHIFSNNQIRKYCLEKYWLGRSFAEENMGLVVHVVQICYVAAEKASAECHGQVTQHSLSVRVSTDKTPAGELCPPQITIAQDCGQTGETNGEALEKCGL